MSKESIEQKLGKYVSIEIKSTADTEYVINMPVYEAVRHVQYPGQPMVFVYVITPENQEVYYKLLSLLSKALHGEGDDV